MKYYPSQIKMAESLGVDRGTVRRWMGKPGFPKATKAGRWNVAKVLTWVEQYNAEREQESGGDRQEKTRLECEKLKVVIARERENLKQAEIETKRQQGKLIGLDEHHAELDEFASIVVTGFDEWIQQVSHLRNPDLLKGAKIITENVRAFMAERIELSVKN